MQSDPSPAQQSNHGVLLMSSMMSNPIMRNGMIFVSVLALLSACAAADQAPPRIVQNDPQSLRPPFQENAGKIGSERAEGAQGSTTIATEDEVGAAGYSGSSIEHLPYERGAVYQLRAAVGASSTIALQPGETLVNYAAGDGELWIIDAANVDDQTRLRIEPTHPDLRTPLLINTDRRSYLVEATSNPEDEVTAILAWTYPHEPATPSFKAAEAESDRSAELGDAAPFSWSNWFFSLSASTSSDPRGCRLCRDLDDHGDNDHGRDHDNRDRGGMH